MSLLKTIFGKREPIQRYGGVNSLVKDIADVIHATTEEVWNAVKKDSPDQNRVEIVIVVNLTLWSLAIDELCRHAPLWSPSQPQQFADQILASVVRHEWGSIDPVTTDAMAGSLILLLQGLRTDREEERTGKIEGYTVVSRACHRPVQMIAKTFPNLKELKFPLSWAISPYYPVGALVNRTALEKVKALNKDGVYAG